MGLPIQNNKKAESNNRRIRLLKKPAQSETTCKQLGVFWAAIWPVQKKHLRIVVRYHNCGWIFDFVFWEILVMNFNNELDT